MAYAQNTYFPFYNPMYNPAQMQQPMSQMQQTDMINRQFQPPMSAQQMPMQQPMSQQTTIQTQPYDDRVWVQGDAGAKAFLVAPGATVILWDTESPRIYIKRADSTGKPLDMDIIDYTIRNSNVPKNAPEHECKCGGKFVPISDFNALREEFAALRGDFEAFASKTKAKKSKEGDE